MLKMQRNALNHKKILNIPDYIHYFASVAILFLGGKTLHGLQKNIGKYDLFLIVIMSTSLIGIWISYYQISIDHNIRIKSAVFFLLLFLLLIRSTDIVKRIMAYLAIGILAANILTYLLYSSPKVPQTTSQKPPQTSPQNPPQLAQFHSFHRNPGTPNCR